MSLTLDFKPPFLGGDGVESARGDFKTAQIKVHPVSEYLH